RGVEQIVANKFEYIAMELVGPGLGHRTYLGARRETLRGCKATGFHLELLQRIRKRKGQAQIVIPIGVKRAVKRIGDTAGETTSHSNIRLVLHTSSRRNRGLDS